VRSSECRISAKGPASIDGPAMELKLTAAGEKHEAVWPVTHLSKSAMSASSRLRTSVRLTVRARRKLNISPVRC
jgi:hypothetical protein